MAKIHSLMITLAAMLSVAPLALGGGDIFIIGPGGNAAPAGGVAAAPVVAPSIAAGEQAEGLHLEAGGDSFQTIDGAGYAWDIKNNGVVYDGSRDAYDGGMAMTVNGGGFSGGEMVIGADSHELEIGPWRHQGLAIWRRVYVDPDRGYCRWIEIFQNTSDEPMTVTVLHMTDLGGATRDTYMPIGHGPDTPTPVSWGMATDDSSSGRPALAHIWGTPNSSNVPIAAAPVGTDDMTFTTQFELAAGATTAICIFQAQRSSMIDARSFVDEFDHKAELAKVPPALRRILLNMQTNVLIAGPLVLKRSDLADTLILQDGRELTGTLLNEQFVIEAFYGPITLQADQVIGLGRVDASDMQVHAALVDGQVVAGRLTSGAIQFQLESQTTMTVPAERLRSVAFAISDDRPTEAPFNDAGVELRSGHRLIFLDGPKQFAYFTEHGQLDLPADLVESIDLTATRGRLHLATLTNGSRLSGLLDDEELTFALQLGPGLTVAKDIVTRVQLRPIPDEPASEGTMLRLKNNDMLYGRLADETLEVETPYGPVTVTTTDISRITTPQDGPLAQVKIDLLDKPAVTGRLVNEALSFAITDETTVEVFVGLIDNVTFPKPIVEAPPEPPVEMASDDPPTSDGPQTYIVQKGDSFWSIAKKVYGKGLYFSVIAEANPDVDPRTMKMGDELLIPPLPEEEPSPPEEEPTPPEEEPPLADEEE